MIPLSESPLGRILKEWVAHYNQGRPHSGLDLEFLILQWIYRRKKFSDPMFRVIIESWQNPFSAACTTSIDLRRLPPENSFFLRSTGRGDQGSASNPD